MMSRVNSLVLETLCSAHSVSSMTISDCTDNRVRSADRIGWHVSKEWEGEGRREAVPVNPRKHRLFEMRGRRACPTHTLSLLLTALGVTVTSSNFSLHLINSHIFYLITPHYHLRTSIVLVNVCRPYEHPPTPYPRAATRACRIEPNPSCHSSSLWPPSRTPSNSFHTLATGLSTTSHLPYHTHATLPRQHPPPLQPFYPRRPSPASCRRGLGYPA